jgi:hypothetical protein
MITVVKDTDDMLHTSASNGLQSQNFIIFKAVILVDTSYNATDLESSPNT